MVFAQVVRYGFFGIKGLFGIILGLICWLIVAWGFWSVFTILQNKFGSPETSWLWQIVRIVLTVLIALAFVQLIFNVFG